VSHLSQPWDTWFPWWAGYVICTAQCSIKAWLSLYDIVGGFVQEPADDYDTVLVKRVTARVFEKPLEALSTSLENEVRHGSDSQHHFLVLPV